MTRVYKILAAADWAKAEAEGRYEGSALDLQDGFIHLSTAAQAGQTARLYFSGIEGLSIVSFDADRLGPDLKWEPSRGGELFPHLFRAIDPSEAVESRPLPLNADGWPDPGPLEP